MTDLEGTEETSIKQKETSQFEISFTKKYKSTIMQKI